jgi:Sad1 / UNC-like C-terminal
MSTNAAAPEVAAAAAAVESAAAAADAKDVEKADVKASHIPAMVPDKEKGEAVKAKPSKLKNYASKDSGAVLLEHSPSAKGSDNLLVDSKDKYCISPCEDKQWVVIGLSEDIQVRNIKLGSYEKYSRSVREFQVSVLAATQCASTHRNPLCSCLTETLTQAACCLPQILASQSFPVEEWTDLGTFTALQVQGEQSFDLPRPILARNLKFKFLSFYGDDYYCTVSQIKVHGSTFFEHLSQEFKATTEVQY